MSVPVILVADDDEDILLLVTTRLRRDGHEVVSASRGDDALALARELKPALAVLDVGMPGLDGLEVLGEIRADEELADTRVLLLTAKAQESDVRRGFEVGADAYVKKPFSPAELSARVRELLA
jgi:DNA-binding response OmpR family regulator